MNSFQGFFSIVRYDRLVDSSLDNSWAGKAERAADICLAPGHWVATLWSGGRTHRVLRDEAVVDGVGYSSETLPSLFATGYRKVLRITAGIVLGLFGILLAIPFRGFAYYNSEEIRLKHKVVERQLSDEEKGKLVSSISERQKLAKEKEECDPMSCLCTIMCLLCYLVCCKN